MSLEFIKPQLASSVDQPPPRLGWIHEVKHDGYRTLLIMFRACKIPASCIAGGFQCTLCGRRGALLLRCHCNRPLPAGSGLSVKIRDSQTTRWSLRHLGFGSMQAARSSWERTASEPCACWITGHVDADAVGLLHDLAAL